MNRSNRLPSESEAQEISGISPEEMAEVFNIPLELYQQYEAGEIDMPVSFIYQVANKFNVELTLY